MIKLSWKQCNERDFTDAIVTLWNSRELEPRTAYRVGRIFTSLQSSMKKCQEKEIAIRESLAKKDEKGNVVYDKESNLPLLADPQVETAQVFHEKMDKILEEGSVDIKVHPLDYGAVVGLSPRHLMALEKNGLITGVPTDL